MSSRALALLNGGGEPGVEAQVEQLSEAVDDLQPTFPKEVVSYSLLRTGFNCPDSRVARLVALAAQKFITEIGDDALQFCKIRQQNPALRDKQRSKEKRLVLTMDDLSAALKDYGINLRKPEYFADRVDGPSPREELKAAKGAESDAEKPAAARKPRKKKAAPAEGGAGGTPDSPKAEKPKKRKVEKEKGDAKTKEPGTS